MVHADHAVEPERRAEPEQDRIAARSGDGASRHAAGERHRRAQKRRDDDAGKRRHGDEDGLQDRRGRREDRLRLAVGDEHERRAERREPPLGIEKLRAIRHVETAKAALDEAVRLDVIYADVPGYSASGENTTKPNHPQKVRTPKKRHDARRGVGRTGRVGHAWSSWNRPLVHPSRTRTRTEPRNQPREPSGTRTRNPEPGTGGTPRTPRTYPRSVLISCICPAW